MSSEIIAERFSQAQSLKAQSITSATTTNGTAVDCSGYDQVTWLLDCGTFTGASPAADVKIQESATSGGTYTDITGAAFAQVLLANDEATYLGACRMSAAKPFQRAVCVSSGTITAIPISCSAVRGKSVGLRKPVATPSFNVTG